MSVYQLLKEKLTDSGPSGKSVLSYQNTRYTVLSDILKTLFILTVSTLICLLLDHSRLPEADIVTIFILSVLIIAVTTTRPIYSILASLLNVMLFNFFFTMPLYTLVTYDTDYTITFLIMFVAAIISSSLTTKIKKQAYEVSRNAYRTEVLLETNQLLQQEDNVQGLYEVTAKQLRKLLNRSVVVYKARDGQLGEPYLYTVHENECESSLHTGVEEKTFAERLFHNSSAGEADGSYLRTQHFLYLPIQSSNMVYGIIGIFLKGPGLNAFEKNLLSAILGECGLALEKKLFERKQEEANLKAKNEQLRANLLRSISHDLRTPLTSISGNAGILLRSDLEESKKEQLYADIYDDSLWLIALVENMLSVTRIDNGSPNLHLETELAEEVIVEALSHVNRLSAQHPIKIVQDEDFLLVKIDAKLITQVIINVVDNAIKYTPPGAGILIHSYRLKNNVVIEIADQGDGIPDNEKEKIFDMFYTYNNTVADGKRSIGLGLFLCRSIMAAHGGNITVKDNHPKGAVFTITLPAEEAHLHG